MAAKKGSTHYTDEQKQAAVALYIVNGNLTQTAKETSIPKTTLFQWLQQEETQKIVEQKRTEKRLEFAEKCWEPINKGVEIINRRMETILNDQSELETLMDFVTEIDDKDIPYKKKINILKKLNHLATPDLREITTAAGTLYDKQALARGEATQNTAINVTMSGKTKEYSE
jgi:transposase-like protein